MKSGAGYAKIHLEQNDYYSEGERVVGQWAGRGAELLGLRGEVTEDAFERVRQGLDPHSGEKLRQRESADRFAADGSKQSSGRSLYDLTFSAPKSVSVMAMEDERIPHAHDKACQEALAEVENHAATRVRMGGANSDRVTGNLIVACYRHDTSRELDPQLHTHAVAANMTYDGTEQRWKALQAGGIYDRRAYLSEVYRNALARELMKMGYKIEANRDSQGKDLGFEIVGISPALREKFSQRSAQRNEAIEKFIQERGRVPTNREIAVLVRETRPDKLVEISTAQVKVKQRGRLTPEEARTISTLRQSATVNRSHVQSPDESLDHATKHVFERVSVAHDFEVLAEALRHNRGQLSLDSLKGLLGVRQAKGAVIRSGDDIATQESLARERDMIDRINRGMGAYERLGGPDNHFEASFDCTPEQKKAVEFILNSRDLAINLQGASGAGKTKTLKQIKYALHTVGKEVFAVAPTQSAVEVLQKEAFADAITCERLAGDPTLQASLAGKVLIVDEAGMVSGKQMARLLEIAEKNHAQLLFTGDTKQLRSVEACDALRILEKDSQLKTIALKSVQRQTGAYREAIQYLRDAPLQGFFMLDKMGAIREVPFLDRPEAVAAAYREALARGRAKGKEPSILIVCPTHEEIGRVTEAIREDRRERGELGMGHVVDRFEPLNWTAAQKNDAQNFEPGHVLLFHKGSGAMRKNEALTVSRIEGEYVVAQTATGEERKIEAADVDRFGVFERSSIEFSANDRIVLQSNRGGWRGPKVTNGEIATVKDVDDQGRIHLKDGRILPADYRQFNHGYAVTAHRSQGKTVDAVIIAGDAMNRELFYVAASRGRESVTVLTTNKDELRESICRSGQRRSALDLFKQAAVDEMIEFLASAQERAAKTNPFEEFLEGLQARGVAALRTWVAKLARAISGSTDPDFDLGMAHGRDFSSPKQDPAQVFERKRR